MFVILQKYDFSSKSQQRDADVVDMLRCLWYCKSTIFQANHNPQESNYTFNGMFVILQKYDFSSKSQQARERIGRCGWCLWYCKSTIFQANHNTPRLPSSLIKDVCDTAKVRFFKQITTLFYIGKTDTMMFVILQKYDFSSKSQLLQACAPPRSDVCDTAKVRFFKQITTQK